MTGEFKIQGEFLEQAKEHVSKTYNKITIPNYPKPDTKVKAKLKPKGERMKQQTIEIMKTLNEIKDKYARELGYADWIDFLRTTGDWAKDAALDEVASRYALEVAKETQRRCAESAKVIIEKTKLTQTGYIPSKRFNMKGVVDKPSILDPKNLAI